MDIECKIKREGGTHVELDDKEYHFKPETDDGPHFCDVANKGHIKTFMSIDAYQLLDADADDAPVDDTEPARDGEGDGVTDADDSAQDDVSHETPDDGDTSDEEPTDEEGDTSDEEEAGEPLGITSKPYEEMDEAEARAAFEGVFGRIAHPKAKAPSIIKKLIEARDTEPTGDGEG